MRGQELYYFSYYITVLWVPALQDAEWLKKETVVALLPHFMQTFMQRQPQLY